MTRWEYQIISRTPYQIPRGVGQSDEGKWHGGLSDLQKLGLEGWEAFAVTDASYYLKRPLVD